MNLDCYQKLSMQFIRAVQTFDLEKYSDKQLMKQTFETFGFKMFAFVYLFSEGENIAFSSLKIEYTFLN